MKDYEISATVGLVATLIAFVTWLNLTLIQPGVAGIMAFVFGEFIPLIVSVTSFLIAGVLYLSD